MGVPVYHVKIKDGSVDRCQLLYQPNNFFVGKLAENMLFISQVSVSFQPLMTLVLFVPVKVIDRCIDQNPSKPGLKRLAGVKSIQFGKDLHKAVIEHFYGLFIIDGIPQTDTHTVGEKPLVKMFLAFSIALSAARD